MRKLTTSVASSYKTIPPTSVALAAFNHGHTKCKKNAHQLNRSGSAVVKLDWIVSGVRAVTVEVVWWGVVVVMVVQVDVEVGWMVAVLVLVLVVGEDLGAMVVRGVMG